MALSDTKWRRGVATGASLDPLFPGAPDLRTVRSPAGEEWLEFRQRLKPRYGVAWGAIAACYLMIAAVLAGLFFINIRWGNDVAFLLVLPMAAWNGYWLLSLNNFVHEGAHWNLATRKSTNDWLANAFVSLLFGQDVRAYRQVHWVHHLHLGDPQDTEVSYHNKPTPRFLLRTALGVHAARVLWTYFRGTGAGRASGPRPADPATRRRWLVGIVRAVALHAVVLASLSWLGLLAVAACWLLSFLSAYPAFNALRQLLEHRSLSADACVDYTRVSHGAVNRMFGNSWLARTFGSAGFNRHLLHHWDPAISYTRFDDMESYLSRTRLAADVDAARTTYLSTLRALMAAQA